MKKSKILSVALASSMILAALTGCGVGGNSNAPAGSDAPAGGETQPAGGDAAPVEEEEITCELLVWSPAEDQAEDQGAWLQTMCEQFAAEHPNWHITFKYGVMNEPEAGPAIVQDVEASADVFMFANDTLATLVPANGIAKLGGKTAEEVRASNSETIVDYLVVDDALYGVPFTTNTWFMYYDKSVYSEEDIKSFNTMLEKGVVSFPLVNSWYFPAFYVANGCTLFGDGTDEAAGIDFTGDKAEEVTKFLVDLVDNPNFKIDDGGSGIAGIRDGSIKAMFSGSWDYAGVKEALGDNFGVAQLPMIDYGNGPVQMKSFAGVKAIGVNPTCEYPQVAVALANYLGGPEAQKAHYEMRNIVPCNTELLKDEAFANDELAKAQNDTMDNTSIMQPFVKAMDNYWTPAENFGKSLRNHEITHENAREMIEKCSDAMNTSLQ